MIKKFVPNGSLTKIILPYTKFNNSQNNDINIKLYVYNKIYNNKNIYTILEIKDIPKYPDLYCIKTSLFADINSKKNHLEEQIFRTKSHLLYELKINNEINSRFYYHSENLKKIENINIKDRISIPVNNLLKDISDEISKSCIDIHI